MVQLLDLVNEVVGSCDWEQGESLGKTWKGRYVFSYGRNEGEAGITAGTVCVFDLYFKLDVGFESIIYRMLLVLALYAMYLFLPALTRILVLIACTQTNTTPYVVVSGVELISDTFTVLLVSCVLEVGKNGLI